MRSILTITLVFAFTIASTAQQTKTDATKNDANVERGKYISENVAMCIQCHSPRAATGELIRTKLFNGAPIPVGKPSQLNVWAEYAPRIAGLPQYSEEQLVKLLTTGIGKEGKPLRSPMPTFKLSLQDARDVAAYLQAIR
jgi:cytochrome c553